MRNIAIILLLLTASINGWSQDSNYLQITDIISANGNIIMTQKRNNKVVLYSSDCKTIIKNWQLNQTPTGVATDGNKVYVTAFSNNGGVAIIDIKSDKIQDFVYTGSGACSPIINRHKEELYICNRFENTLSVIGLKSGNEIKKIKLLREPSSAAYDSKRQKLYVTNFLPIGSANVESIGASISIINTKNLTVEKHIELESGSNALRSVIISEDSNYLLATHNLGRFQLPTTQLQQGWMNTSAMSVIDLDKGEFIASLLLDEPDKGAAGIWDVKCANEKIVISHSGVHELSIIDYNVLKERLENHPDKKSLAYDLSFMAGIKNKITLKGNGPRKIAVEGNKIIVPTYFSDTLNIVSLKDEKVIETVSMVSNRVVDSVLLGEQYFNDATFCFQNWQSCNGCHPGDARTDGLNWDLLNDGIGNSKNCKSLLFSHKTPPAMISGIRESSFLAVRTGYRFIQFHDIEEKYATCVDAYLLSLKPVPSPLLKRDGSLSKLAKKGKKIFKQLGCDDCHNGEYYTDGNMYRIGQDIEFKNGWDTPTLREVWRTAPYLFDGRAATMVEVFSTYKHGIHGTISKKDATALAEFVNSL